MHLDKYTRAARVKISDVKAFYFDFLSKFLYMPIEMIIIYLLWEVVYHSFEGSFIAGYTLNDILLYYLYARISERAISTNLSMYVERDIMRGNLDQYLCKPVDYVWFTYSVYIAQVFFGLAIGLPFFFILSFVLKLFIQTDSVYLIFFFFSVLLSVLISISVDLLIGLCAFWIKRTTGIKSILLNAQLLLSGALIPLTLFTSKVQGLLQLLPFSFIYFLPPNIYLAKMGAYQILVLLVVGSAWTAVLIAATHILWSHGRRRYESYGG